MAPSHLQAFSGPSAAHPPAPSFWRPSAPSTAAALLATTAAAALALRRLNRSLGRARPLRLSAPTSAEAEATYGRGSRVPATPTRGGAEEQYGRWALLMALGIAAAEQQRRLPAGVWGRAGSRVGPASPAEHAWAIAAGIGFQVLVDGALRRLSALQHGESRREDRELQPIAMAAILGGKLKTRTLGTSDLRVTDVCLGTMTWGIQNTEAEAHQQLDYAVKERGVNFIDTAEMYPVPMFCPEWVPGTTETYIGSWLAKNPGLRQKLVLATKVVGRMSTPTEVVAQRSVPPGPAAPAQLDAASVTAACHASLRRLQTDYIDLYQVHWPDRYVPIFGSSQYNPKQERSSVPIQETVQALWDLIKEGKIRHYGLSNETTYGVCEWVRAADELGAPRPVAIQNSFCLLNRTFATELAEACAPSHYNIPLLPYSPLGGGALSGKYRDAAAPPGSRFARYPQFMTRYVTPASLEAINQYAAIAEGSKLSLATLALAWCRSRWFVGSTIIGATSLAQLQEDIDAFTVTLEENELKALDAVHAANKDPVISP